MVQLSTKSGLNEKKEDAHKLATQTADNVSKKKLGDVMLNTIEQNKKHVLKYTRRRKLARQSIRLLDNKLGELF